MSAEDNDTATCRGVGRANVVKTTPYQKWMTRPSKWSILEGDLAILSTSGFPLPLCLQLQLSCLRIDEAMWTARSTPGGFSVNLFWPAPAPEKNDVQPKKRKN